MKSKNRSLSLFLKGLLMGSADIVPGVSGGTMALITGIYQELIKSIHDIGPKTIAAPFLLISPSKRKTAWKEICAVNWSFLIPLGLGIVIAILSLSKVIPHLLETQPLTMYSLFFGLIVASIIFPWQMVEGRAKDWGIATLFAVLAFLLTGTETLSSGSLNPFYVFICGAIAITAMILPGISGSYLLVILGEYKLILEAIHARDVVTVGIFMLGILVGVLSFSRLLNWLLEHRLSVTMAALAGIMLGSLRKVWPGFYIEASTPTTDEWVIISGFTFLGLLIVFALQFFNKKFSDQADNVST